MVEREIGGFIELELPTGSEYHHEALQFNSGRNALAYYLLKNNISELFVPVYICESIPDILQKANIQIQFYNLDENFTPLISPEEVGDRYILLVNYFGICEKIIKSSIKKFKNKIVDNSHAFFSNPESDVPTFYSPRQFFGVADGGYLYARGMDNSELSRGESAQWYMARLVRIESGAKAGYYIYRNTEQLISRAKILKMSILTQKVLASIRYDMVWEKRESNFKYLHNKLQNINLLNIIPESVHGPMVYPLLTEDENLRSFLIEKGIYIHQFWPEVIERENINSFENEISVSLCALPIDQRYSKAEMTVIVDLIESFLKKKKSEAVAINELEKAETYR